jgi:type II secretory pathway pseudopilin PulG
MSESSEKKGIPVIVWGLIGCGCLGFGVVVLGIIAAIALPSFLNQASKAKQSEAKTYVGAMLRAEQAYFLERSQFTTSLSELGIGISTASPKYEYKITTQPGSPPNVMVTATAKQASLKSFTGVVFALKTGKEETTVTQLCETDRPAIIPPAMPAAPQSLEAEIPCPAGSSPVVK